MEYLRKLMPIKYISLKINTLTKMQEIDRGICEIREISSICSFVFIQFYHGKIITSKYL